jgi:hypothetical protein
VDLSSLPKRRPLRLTYSEIILPLFCSNRHKDVFGKVENYIRTKLSLDYMLRESDEFDRVKAMLLNPQELYVFENMDRVKSRILNNNINEQFEMEKFRQAYQQALTNQKIMSVIQ